MTTLWSAVVRLGLLLGLLSLAFAAGSNWHRLDAVMDRADPSDVRAAIAEQYARDTYVRKDVLEQQLENIMEELNAIRAAQK
ncbi:MAG: hypothetical protein ACREJC_10955 [Tepidisphaeraceae bacterium]